MGYDTFSIDDIKVGDRVRVHPASDHFARGIRYGTVTSKSGMTNMLKCLSDSGRVFFLHVANVLEIVEFP